MVSITDALWGESTWIGGFPSQMADNEESATISWRYHKNGMQLLCSVPSAAMDVDDGLAHT